MGIENQFKVETRTVAAGKVERVPFSGQHVRFLSAGSQLDIAVVTDAGIGSFAPLPVGVQVRFEGGYREVIVRNPSAGPVTFEIVLSVAAVDDSRFTAEGSIAVRGGGGGFSYDGSIATSTAAAVILAANGDRTSAIIYAGAADLWLGPDNTVTATGEPTLKAGEKLTVGHTAVVYGIRASGTADAGAYEETV